ncbi:MAG: hypothetical protein FJ090_00520 [Deltaproteobacteria bacterium]|nr:hypothetical protein [Deltaproteobacteria bacterium]
MEPKLRVLPTVANPALENAARRHWAAITVAVAWELARCQSKVRAPLLEAAREHALWRVGADASLAEAEAVAAAAARDYLDRRAGKYAPFVDDPDDGILPDPRWREAVLGSVTPMHEAVFRLHYGDGVPLESVARKLEVDLSWVRPAREAVRELVRAVVAEDGISTEGWAAERLDRLVTRVALAAGDRCPGPGGLATELGRAHAEECPRCGRALRLFREGVVAPADLFPPPNEIPVPPAAQRLVLVELHPDQRRHARALDAALTTFVRVDPDTLVGPPGEAAHAALVELALEGKPPRAALRVASAAVPGALRDGVVIGHVLARLRELARTLPWGEVRGVEPLPDPLPPPPSAARWWATAGLLVTFAVGAAVLATRPAEQGARFELAGARVVDTVVFDTSDEAYVDVAAIGPGHAELLFHSTTPSEKAAIATGDGRFRLPADSRAILLVSAGEELRDMAEIVAAASSAEDARRRVRDRYPSAAALLVR